VCGYTKVSSFVMSYASSSSVVCAKCAQQGVMMMMAFVYVFTGGEGEAMVDVR